MSPRRPSTFALLFVRASAARLGALSATALLLVSTGAALGTASSVAGDVTRASSGSSEMRVRVVSGHPMRMTGGDALLKVSGTSKPPTVSVDGRTLRSSATATSSGWLVAIEGLRVGRHRLQLVGSDGKAAGLQVRNFPTSGPVFAGEQVQPWPCATVEAGLGPARNAACEADSVSSLQYLSRTANVFLPYVEGVSDADVTTTLTDAGERVPFIIREETGVLDRGIYSWAALWQPDRRYESFVGKVLVPFKGGCDPVYAQTQPVDITATNPATAHEDGILNARYALSRGFGVATSSNLIFGNQCNSVVAAETVMMLKEHIVEATQTPIRYTIGSGCSGGSILQMSIAASYPGILDGLMPMCTFTDFHQVYQEAQDCSLVNRAFNANPALAADPTKRQAVIGYGLPTACLPGFDGPTGFSQRWADPDNPTFCKVPLDQIYDAESRPGGVRCTAQDYNRASVGVRPDGRARSPFDNVGVQYGLGALRDGALTAEEFVVLNESIGGYDIDWNWKPRRSRADAPQSFYRSGWVTSYHRLARVPIVDLHGWDLVSGHKDIHSESLRARLDQDAGGHGNQILWKAAVPTFTDPVANQASFDVMTTWLDAVTRDRSSLSLREKVLVNKPDSAIDSCWIAGVQVRDFSRCEELFPSFSDPRLVAGGPLTDDIIKCRLEPIDPDSYPYRFNADQLERLREVFPRGVCDYSRPGVGQRPTAAWRVY